MGHTLLFNYGLPENGSNAGSDDADSDLVPGLVEKVALPLLHHEIAHCWDMLSTEETRNAVSATTLVINYFSVSCEPLRGLLVVVSARLSDAVTSLMVPMEPPGAKGSTECCPSCCILIWDVSPSHEEHLFVERDSCNVSSREARS
ncbi:hypothetical protein MLD38_024382 [Melastoma candidum]|uniref:Uncharacterized protein n=1 Tax=Melastoma candidum TaxID=119954 RepID=A0ACB9NX63_9MYRT|nr:hypothetical protein MLD38_024382 [Melastoma candidum]